VRPDSLLTADVMFNFKFLPYWDNPRDEPRDDPA
jgi:hypothetical protein